MTPIETAVDLAAEAITQIVEVLKQHDARLRAIEETREPRQTTAYNEYSPSGPFPMDVFDRTREPQPEKKVPMPLTNAEIRREGQSLIDAGLLASYGLGIYRISEVEEACR